VQQETKVFNLYMQKNFFISELYNYKILQKYVKRLSYSSLTDYKHVNILGELILHNYYL